MMIFILMNRGKVEDLHIENDIKVITIRILNLTIPKPKNIKNTRIMKEKILPPPWIRTVPFTLNLMKPTENIIYTPLKMD